jgi:hypothetical protein
MEKLGIQWHLLKIPRVSSFLFPILSAIPLLTRNKNSSDDKTASNLPNESAAHVTQINLMLRFPDNDATKKAQFFDILRKTVIRETERLDHPIIGGFGFDSWPFFRPYTGKKVPVLLEKPYTFGKLEIKAEGHFDKADPKALGSSYRLNVNTKGSHGSVHSAFMNGGLGNF